MEKLIYLLVNFFSIIVCFIFSFHPRVKFSKHFGAFLKAAFMVMIPFIVWDVYFNHLGVWWFNDRYLIGLRFLELPIEELLFFLCIPFACTYSWFVFRKYYTVRFSTKVEQYFVVSCIVICLVAAFFCREMIYPLWTFLFTAFTLFYLKYIAKIDWIGEIVTVYTLLLVPFFMVNGVLTGTGLEEAIVNYNPGDFMGIRIGTVPVEDAVYGFSLISWNVYLFDVFAKKKNGEN